MNKTISLNDLLYNGTEINYPNDCITIKFDVEGPSATFRDRTVICKKLIFEYFIKEDFNFYFYDCTFDCEVEFIGCVLDEIAFKNTKSIKSLNLDGDFNKFELKSLKFHYDKEYTINDPKPQLTTDFYISNIVISNNLLFQNIDHIAGKFEFKKNKLGGKGINAITFANSNFCNAHFLDNDFYDDLSFRNTSFNYNLENLETPKEDFNYTRFYDNTFKKVNFSNTKFINKCKFYKCNFLSTTWFEDCKNIDNTELKFVACKFEKYVLFNNSKFNKIEILHSKFLEKASFENFETNSFKINQVTFADAAYFDDLNRNNNKATENWDRKTIRTIKQELQKAENRIDFNRFRAYELAAHYQELNYKENFKDVAILWATKWSSNYGSWTWAFWFTLIIGLVFFTPFFILENFDKSFNLNNSQDFLYGYLRFFLITDFKNEYYEAGESVLKFNCILSLLPFIIGKIAVAFGIYEMVQSFRKFKA